MSEEEDCGDPDEKDGDDAVESLGPQPYGPARPEPGAGKTARKEGDKYVITPEDTREGNGGCAEGQGGGNYDKAHGLVEDDGFESGKAKGAYQQGKSKLGTPETDEAAKDPYDRPAAEYGERIVAGDALFVPGEGAIM